MIRKRTQSAFPFVLQEWRRLSGKGEAVDCYGALLNVMWSNFISGRKTGVDPNKESSKQSSDSQGRQHPAGRDQRMPIETPPIAASILKRFFPEIKGLSRVVPGMILITPLSATAATAADRDLKGR